MNWKRTQGSWWNKLVGRWSAVLLFSVAWTALQAASLPYIELPSKDTPWEVDTYFDGQRFTLTLPFENNGINLLPKALAEQLRQRAVYREGNIEAAIQAQQQLHQLLSAGPVMKQLEYQRELNNVVISIHPRDVEQYPDPLYRHQPLLEKLPDYTRLQLFVPDFLVADTQKSLVRLGLNARSKINPVDIWARYESNILLQHSTSRWAQDLFEAVQDSDGKTQIIVPMSRYQINDLSRSDNDYLYQLKEDGYGVIKTPLFFRGGNLLVGESNRDKKILFIGERELVKSRGDFYTSLFIQPDEQTLIEMMRRFSGADEVVVIPNSQHLFHLDMAMSFIGKGKVALLSPIDHSQLSKEDQQVLVALKQQLQEAAFDVISIPTTASRIEKFQSSVNGIVYTNADNKALHAFVPKYEDQQVRVKNTMQSLNHLIMQAYREGGVEPMAIEERFHSLSGNLHCAFKVID